MMRMDGFEVDQLVMIIVDDLVVVGQIDDVMIFKN